MKMKPLIVGSGPVGGFLASKLGSCTIIDQKKRIGHPVRCTGILTTDIEPFFSSKEIKSFTLNNIQETKVIGPTKKVRIPLSTNYIICNTTFEEFLLEKAQHNGADLLLQHKYLKSTTKGHEVRDMQTREKKTLPAKTLIGCDGPQSEVAKHHGLMQKRRNYIGLQVRLKVKEHENIIKFYPHIAKYAWYAPESDKVARVGICTDKNAPKELDMFLKRFKGSIIEKQAGFIPYHQPFRKTVSTTKTHKAVLLGDSAAQVKNTTGGGIIPGIKTGNILSKNILGYHKQPSSTSCELYSHFLVHNLLKCASRSEWDKIIATAKQLTEELETINRDQLVSLLPKLASKPWLVSYGVKKVLSGSVTVL